MQCCSEFVTKHLLLTRFFWARIKFFAFRLQLFRFLVGGANEMETHHSRRTVLGWLATLPLAGKLFATVPKGDGPEFRYEHAIRVVRIVNTAQAWYKAKNGFYPPMPELLRGPTAYSGACRHCSQVGFLRAMSVVVTQQSASS